MSAHLVSQHAGWVTVRNDTGVYEVCTALPSCDPDSQVPLRYAGPGYVARLTLANGRVVVDDLRYAVGQVLERETSPNVGGIRGGLMGGLGAFACDWYRPGAGLSQLDARRIAQGPPWRTWWHKWMSARAHAGVYAVDGVVLREQPGRVTLHVRTRYRDLLGHAFDVSYGHVWTADRWQLHVQVLLAPAGPAPAWVKEPRLVGVGNLAGQGIGIKDTRRRVHHYTLTGLKDPTRTTLTIGPSANSPANRYDRAAVVWPWGQWRIVGGFETSGWAQWRHDYSPRRPPTAVVSRVGGEVVGDYNPHSMPEDMATVVIATGPHRVPRGSRQTPMPLDDNWEITKRPWFQETCVALHSFPGSITVFDFLGCLRRVRRGDSYGITLILR